MSFESIKPIFIKHELAESKDSFTLTNHFGKTSVTFRKGWLPYYKLMAQRKSLSEVVLECRKNKYRVRFGALKHMLDTLCINGFLQNSAEFNSTLAAMSNPFRWTYSLLRDPILDVRLIPEGRTSLRIPALAVMLSLILIAAEAYFLPVLLQVRIDRPFLDPSMEIWKSLLLIYATSSAALSAKGFLSFFLTWLATGHRPSLKIAISLLGLSLNTESKTLLASPRDKAMLIVIPAVSLSFTLILPYAALISPPLAACLVIVWLFELSPFSKSDLTSFLKWLFNTSKKRDFNQQKLFSVFHIFTSYSWVLVLAILLSLYVFPFLIERFQMFFGSEENRFDMIDLAALYLGTMSLSIVSEIISSVSYYGPIDRIKRIWQDPTKTSEEPSSAIKTDPKSLLTSNPFFSAFAPDLIEKIAQHTKIRRVPANVVICKQGALESDLYILLEGEVEVWQKTLAHQEFKLAVLKKDSVFGEIGFFAGKPRSADVRTRQKCTIAKVSRDALETDTTIEWEKLDYIANRIRLYQTMVSSGQFKDMPYEAIQILLRVGQFQDFTPGQRVIKEGDAGRAFYIIQKGALKVYQEGTVLRSLERGDVFGEIALLEDVPRTATVVAETNSRILAISVDEFWRVLANNFPFGLFLEKLGFARLHK
jgi:CRP-like cAMP-binding protein